jgi:tRNA U34 2-thiouridine synthase MnmA/TrmU
MATSVYPQHTVYRSSPKRVPSIDPEQFRNQALRLAKNLDFAGEGFIVTCDHNGVHCFGIGARRGLGLSYEKAIRNYELKYGVTILPK